MVVAQRPDIRRQLQQDGHNHMQHPCVRGAQPHLTPRSNTISYYQTIESNNKIDSEAAHMQPPSRLSQASTSHPHNLHMNIKSQHKPSKAHTHARTQSGSSSRDRAGIPTFQTATLTSAHKGRRRRVIRLNFNSARNQPAHTPAALAWPCIAHVCMCKYVPQSACTYHRVSDPCPRRFRPARP